MKKILLSFIPFFLIFSANAQLSDFEKNKASKLLTLNKNAIGLSDYDLKNLTVSNAYYRKEINLQMVYLLQTYKGIPVYNQIIVLAFRENKLVSKTGFFLSSIDKLAATQSALPIQSADKAVRTAITEVKATMPASIIPINGAVNNDKIDFGKMGIAYENVTAKLMWIPVKDQTKTKVRLAWQVTIAPNNTDDYWNIRIDANDNKVIDKSNLTVYDNFKISADEATLLKPLTTLAPDCFSDNNKNSIQNNHSPNLVSNANYLVIPYPAESPTITPPTPVTNPWMLAGGTDATTLGWHSDGAADYTITRGNNVWATEDRNNTNQNTGVPATSTTSPDPLSFNFTPDFTQAPTVEANQRFATTNLFYWNNIMHDLSYNYGFDEVSGNFQTNNLGRGGAENDNVMALAQSGAGTDNANFTTPADGGRGMMRMYLFTIGNANPQRDGDLDNGIIAHEYAHGISNRLTGSIAGGGNCLFNAEQAGEGWSDYFALMLTQNWATSTVNDGFNVPRSIGLYALNNTNVFNGSAPGTGIRHYKYCTNMAINPLTYAQVASSGGQVHDIGEIWCATLWDMTWNIIQQDNAINPDLFNAAGAGGNSVALKLVIEGMRLQPCSPGFLDSRDAILKADELLYGGKYRCAIMNAFARRGMGVDARQGSSNATNDQIPGFSTESSKLELTQNTTQQQEGQHITYNNKITAYCTALNNYVLRDTLPTNVTYVSGGNYDAVNRVVSFPVNIAAGTSQTYSFTVGINEGSYFPTVNLFEDVVANASIPATWQSTSSTNNFWVSSTARSYSTPNAYFSPNIPVASDERLFFSNQIALGSNPPDLTFWHWFATEPTYDGGILEISTDNGVNYTPIPPAGITTGGYTDIMDASTVLAGLPAWTGSAGEWTKVTVPLTPYANQNIKLRFRSTTDLGTNAEGWYIDDIKIKREPLVNIRSSLFNANNVRVNVADTSTIILPGCPPIVQTQPVNSTVCINSQASFNIVASGGGTLTYQWQVSTDGNTWVNVSNAAPYAGVTTTTLIINPAAIGLNNNQYRCIISSSACPMPINSNAAVLNVAVASVGGVIAPANITICGGNNSGTLTLSAYSGSIVQWESATNIGGPWTTIANTTNTLTYTNLTQTTFYRVVVQANGCTAVNSTITTVTVNAPITVTADPVNTVICTDKNGSFVVNATGASLAYQWQVSVDGNNFTNIANGGVYNGANTSTLIITEPPISMNLYRYRVVINGAAPCTPYTSAPRLLFVKVPPTITIAASPYTKLFPGLVTKINSTVTGGDSPFTYTWFKNGVVLPANASAFIDIDVDGLGDYTLDVADINGCTSNSNVLSITDSVNNKLFIYPNPNNGQFQVRYYSNALNSSIRTLTIYDAKGARILTRNFTIIAPYISMDVDLRGYGRGIYWIDLREANGNRLATGNVAVQ